MVPGAASEVRIHPLGATPRRGTSLELRAEVVDTFGNAIAAADASWSVTGPGTLSSTTGVGTRLRATGTVTVTAASGSVRASASFSFVEQGSQLVGTAATGAGALVGG